MCEPSSVAHPSTRRGAGRVAHTDELHPPIRPRTGEQQPGTEQDDHHRSGDARPKPLAPLRSRFGSTPATASTTRPAGQGPAPPRTPGRPAPLAAHPTRARLRGIRRRSTGATGRHRRGFPPGRRRGSPGSGPRSCRCLPDVRQQSGQPAVGPVRAGLHGTHRHPKSIGGLLVGEPLEVGGPNHGALVFG